MNNAVTVLAPITLAPGKTEADLLAASAVFQDQFARHEPGILRRELVRTGPGTYLDIVKFRSVAEAEAVIAKEMESEVCHAFFAVMDLTNASEEVVFHPSLETYAAN